MAQNTRILPHSAAVRLRQWVHPSRRQVTLIVAIEVGLTLFGLPLWAHLAVAIAAHWIVVEWRS